MLAEKNGDNYKGVWIKEVLVNLYVRTYSVERFLTQKREKMLAKNKAFVKREGEWAECIHFGVKETP